MIVKLLPYVPIFVHRGRNFTASTGILQALGKNRFYGDFSVLNIVCLGGLTTIAPQFIPPLDEYIIFYTAVAILLPAQAFYKPLEKIAFTAIFRF